MVGLVSRHGSRRGAIRIATRISTASTLTVAALLAGCGTSPSTGDDGVGQPDSAAPDASQVESVLELGRFLLTRGADTIAYEDFTRGDASVRSTLRISGGPTLRIEAQAEPDALVSRAAFQLWPPGAFLDPPPALDLVVTFSGTSVAVQRTAAVGGRTTERREVRPGTVPFVNPSTAMLEFVIARSRAAGERSVPLYDPVSGGAMFEAFVSEADGDSVSVRLPDGEYIVALDSRGRILGGRVDPAGVMVRRVAQTVN